MKEERIKSLFEAAYLLTGLTRLELSESAYNQPEKIMVRKVMANILFKDVDADIIAPFFNITKNAVSRYLYEDLTVTELKMKAEMMHLYCQLMKINVTVVTYQKNQELPDSIVWNDEEWEIVPTLEIVNEKTAYKKFGNIPRKELAL